MKRILFALAAAAAGAAIATAAAAQDDPQIGRQYSGDFFGADHDDHGTLTLISAPGGVIVHIEIKNVKPGWHGVHLDQTGTCDGPDYGSAGAHIGAAGGHGYLTPGATEPGDLPNIYVGDDGHGYAEFFTPLVTATPVDGRPYLVDDDGTAVVIDATADDYKSSAPAPRLLCAPLQ